MELIEGLQKLVPWATNLPIVPKIVLSVILTLFTVLVLLLIWNPISHPQARGLIRELQEISQLIAKEPEGDKKLQYLIGYLNQHSINSEFLKPFTGDPNQVDIHVRPIDRFLAVTLSMWRNSGLLIVLGPDPGVIAILDDDMGLGIKDLKVVSQPSAFPVALLVVRELVLVGTGTYAESIKTYVVDSDNIFLSLEKPYFEYNSGWGAFKDAIIVTFKLKNEYLVNSKGLVEIHTKGAAILEDEENNTDYRILPEERYVWDKITRSFKQISGRDAHGRFFLAEIYGDLGDAVGDWFKTPEEVRGRVDFLKTLDENW